MKQLGKKKGKDQNKGNMWTLMESCRQFDGNREQ